METHNWYVLSPQETLKQLTSQTEGLTADEAKRRLQEYGLNKLAEQKRKSLFSIFLDQFKSPLIYVLIVADVLVFFLHEFTDGFIILFILLFNSILGTIQEGRAENTLASLSKFVETKAEVLRDGKEIEIPDYEVVPGDIVLLQEGQKIPADARLIEASNLKTEEAALTGESEPVRKHTDILQGTNLTTSEQRNMVFKGTTIAVGAGKALVVGTGTNTVIGGISQAIAEINTEIPLTKNLKQLARIVVIIVGAIIALIMAVGIFEGRDIQELFSAAVALSVASIPEGLPLVLTVTLATGVWRMAKRRVLVKKLQAVEALGEAQELAVDKTGTITKNELVIRHVISGGILYDISGVGYDPNPKIEKLSPELKLAAEVALSCSNARISFSEDDNVFRLVGDPTEGAMTAFASKTGLSKQALLKKYPLVADWPFDYQKKFHCALFKKQEQFFFAITGAPESILELSTTQYFKGGDVRLAKTDRDRLTAQFLEFSKRGLRVIAFAFASDAPKNADPDRLPSLTFGGFLVMHDALREGIRENVELALEAGIRTIMITGDHAVTAQTIAREAGIYRDGDLILTGAEIDAMTGEELSEKVKKTSVFARVTPEHKMKIIEVYRKRGETIAMTGDGVNDAPSLVAADLGIAMGRIGTEVAKDASDIVLMDDNFKDILSAVEEGRNMREAIRRVITYLFSSNLGELLLILIALFGNYPLPLLAGQLIWMNVVTDTFFDISLALEPKNKTLMKRKKIRKKLLDKTVLIRLMVLAPIIALGAFWLFQAEINDPVRARTFALTSLVIFQWFNALNCRSEEKSIFSMRFFSNKFLTATLGGVILLHMFAVYNPFMNSILRISPLAVSDWLKIAAVGCAVLIVEEMRKLLYRRQLAASA